LIPHTGSNVDLFKECGWLKRRQNNTLYVDGIPVDHFLFGSNNLRPLTSLTRDACLLMVIFKLDFCCIDINKIFSMLINCRASFCLQNAWLKSNPFVDNEMSNFV
jgi:hypothetical protein